MMPRLTPGQRRWRVATARPGVTTTELVVASLVFSVFTTGLFSLLLSALRNWDSGSSKSYSDNSASLALQKAAREIMDGKEGRVNADGSLTVQMPRVNDQGNYERYANGDTIKLYVSDGFLWLQRNTSTAERLWPRHVNETRDTKIIGATFTVTGPQVSLTITAQTQTGRKVTTTQFSQIVSLRNIEIY